MVRKYTKATLTLPARRRRYLRRRHCRKFFGRKPGMVWRNLGKEN